MSQDRLITCTCGQVEVTLIGPSILTTICHCDDCQEGARQLHSHGAPDILDEYAGTAYIMQRKDRLQVTRGGEHLYKHKLNGDSPTNRVMATCCNTPMFVSFDNAIHWFSVYRDRALPDAPPAKMRLQTKFIPLGTSLPEDMPAFASFPYRFAFKLIGANIAMWLGR